MDIDTITPEDFLASAKHFIEISDKIHDGWRIYEHKNEIHKSYIKKEAFITFKSQNELCLYKIEYVIFYNLSYGVPSFSFNVWNSPGTLLKLEEIRQMCFIQITKEEFYSVITQQEHPIFHRPYFIMHPCHTAQLLKEFKNKSRNIVVTFLGLISPLLRLNLSLEYGL
ncbi:unnamed protein product [Parnassius mnemosyne]|uniref:Ubiquitin-like-conjugating enzyme ATG10 n=1 Tax=Parnassius mnemosyne TaxID=213953 RepID=A0AAV1M2I7_9NEOP